MLLLEKQGEPQRMPEGLAVALTQRGEKNGSVTQMDGRSHRVSQLPGFLLHSSPAPPPPPLRLLVQGWLTWAWQPSWAQGGLTLLGHQRRTALRVLQLEGCTEQYTAVHACGHIHLNLGLLSCSSCWGCREFVLGQLCLQVLDPCQKVLLLILERKDLRSAGIGTVTKQHSD